MVVANKPLIISLKTKKALNFSAFFVFTIKIKEFLF